MTYVASSHLAFKCILPVFHQYLRYLFSSLVSKLLEVDIKEVVAISWVDLVLWLVDMFLNTNITQFQSLCALTLEALKDVSNVLIQCTLLIYFLCWLRFSQFSFPIDNCKFFYYSNYKLYIYSIFCTII